MGKFAGAIINAAISAVLVYTFGPVAGFSAFGGISLTTGAALAGLGSCSLGAAIPGLPEDRMGARE